MFRKIGKKLFAAHPQTHHPCFVISNSKVTKFIRRLVTSFSLSQKYPSVSSNQVELSGYGSISSTSSSSDDDDDKCNDIILKYVRNTVHLIVPLPSQKQNCRFILKPFTQTIGDLVQMIRNEDKGIEQLNVYTIDNVRQSASTTIRSMLESDFKIRINDIFYFVFVPKAHQSFGDSQNIHIENDIRMTNAELANVYSLVHKLHESFKSTEYVEIYQNNLQKRLDLLKQNLEPMEMMFQQVNNRAKRKTSILAWSGLGLMSIQFGMLARLTFWEYSWDIIEPITYFITYSYGIACYAYFLLTKESYTLPAAENRQYMIATEKNARKLGLNIAQYQQLKNQVAQLESELQKLRENSSPLSNQSSPTFPK